MRRIIIALVATAFVAALPADAVARGRRRGGGRSYSGHGFHGDGAGHPSAPAYTSRSGYSGGSSAVSRADCTRSAPCIGPRGGRYYYTASGSKQYLPR